MGGLSCDRTHSIDLRALGRPVLSRSGWRLRGGRRAPSPGPPRIARAPARRGRRTRRNCGRHRHLARRERLSAEQQEIALWVSVAMWLEARNRPGIQRPAVIRLVREFLAFQNSGFLPYISHSCGCDLVKAKGRCRVARSGRPLLALARSVLGDFHHTAPPSVRLVLGAPDSDTDTGTRKRETLE